MKKKVAWPILIGVGFFIAFGLPKLWSPSDTDVVKRVVDGDTVQLVSGLKVRLIGVDTPELRDSERNQQNADQMNLDRSLYERYAEEAKDFLSDLVLHRAVRLEYDERNKGNNHRDKYGRLLAYLWIEPPFEGVIPEWAILGDNPPYTLSLNGSLIRAGYSRAYRNFQHKQTVSYLAYEQEARSKRRGFWQGLNTPIKSK